jgi:hypothetical protein
MISATLASFIAVGKPATQAPLGGHVAHLAGALAFLVLTLGGVAVGEHTLRRRPRKPTTGVRSRLLVIVAVAGAGAAAVHYVVMPTHFAEATLYGVFFAVAATSQLGYSALLLLRPSRPLLAAGVVGNLAMVSLWLLTRAVAIPLGPAAGSTESFSGLDILASSFETLAIIAGAIALIRVPVLTRSRLRSLASPQAAMLILVVAAAVTTTTYLSPPS